MDFIRPLPHAANHSLRGSGGFTLIELIISIVLLGFLAAVGTSMISDSFNTTYVVNASQANAGQARYALERLEREIREIKYDNINNSYCITAMTATNLVFYKTTSGGVYNSTCATNAYTVTIDFSNPPNLTLQYSSTAAKTLSNQATSFTLQYLDALNSSTGVTASNVRFVVITLTVTDPTSGQSIAQRTRVALRNN